MGALNAGTAYVGWSDRKNQETAVAINEVTSAGSTSEIDSVPSNTSKAKSAPPNGTL